MSTRRHQNRHDPAVERSRVPSFRPTLRSLVYVVAVALVATAGFTQESPWPILFAALLALPASIVAAPSYYVVYGVLALIPGANPSSNTGFETVDADGRASRVIISIRRPTPLGCCHSGGRTPQARPAVGHGGYLKAGLDAYTAYGLSGGP